MFKETMKGALFGITVLASSMANAYLPTFLIDASKDMYEDFVSPDPLNLQVVAFHGSNDCGYSIEQLRSAITETASKNKIQTKFVSGGDPKNGKLALFVTTSCRTFFGEKKLELNVRFGDPRTKPAKLWAPEYGAATQGDRDRLDYSVREGVKQALYHYGAPNNLPKP